MADDIKNLRRQRFGLWDAIYDIVGDFYRYFQDRFGFYFEDDEETVRARLKLEDDGSTKLTLKNKDGSYIVAADGYVAHYDSSGKKRRVDSYTGTVYYAADGTTIVRQDDINGTTIKNTSGTKLAEFSKDECGVYTDASNFLKFIPTGLSLYASGAARIQFGYTGVLLGTNGTRTFTLDPSVLASDANFKATDVCGNQSMHALRSTPA